MSVYTVGNTHIYDDGIANLGRDFCKLGPREGYPGGFAVNSVDDGLRLIIEMGKETEWSVYELDADWEQDTLPSKNGWWHALQRDAVILKKVPLANG